MHLFYTYILLHCTLKKYQHVITSVIFFTYIINLLTDPFHLNPTLNLLKPPNPSLTLPVYHRNVFSRIVLQ